MLFQIVYLRHTHIFRNVKLFLYNYEKPPNINKATEKALYF